MGNAIGTTALRRVDIENVIFINVETVPELPEYDDLSPAMQRLWDLTAANLEANSSNASDVYNRAGEFAEFGKVVCISVGVIRLKDGQPYFVSSSYVGEDERQVLDNFAGMINNAFDRFSGSFLCGHGIRRADVPFFAKRMLVNHLQLPAIFDPNGRRPVTSSIIDTADFWAFSDLAAPRASAELLVNVFGINCNDGDYDSSEAARLYYDEHDVEALRLRSERKALAAAQLMLRFRGSEFIPADHIISK